MEHIVSVLYEDFVRNEQITLVQLSLMLADNFETIKWCAKRHLLANYVRYYASLNAC